MQTVKSLRPLFALVLLAAGVVQLVASPPYQYWRTYYTDASKTVECGYADVSCSGTHYSGCWTAHHNDEYLAACGSGGGACDDAKIGSECADNFDNDGVGGADLDDADCQPCLARFE